MSTTAGNYFEYFFILLSTDVLLLKLRSTLISFSPSTFVCLPALMLVFSKSWVHQNMMQTPFFSTQCTLLMKLIKHHAWQSKKLTQWEPKRYRFNFSWFAKTTTILYNKPPQSWWRQSSALIFSLPLEHQITLLSHTNYLSTSQVKAPWIHQGRTNQKKSDFPPSSLFSYTVLEDYLISISFVLHDWCGAGTLNSVSSFKFCGPSRFGLRREQIHFSQIHLSPTSAL